MLQLGKESTVQALGKTWVFGRAELSVIAEFKDWVAAQIGDPFFVVDRYADKLSPEMFREKLKEAEAVRDQLASFSLGCALAIRFLNTEAGAAKLTQLLLRANHPRVTEEDALAILLEMGAAKLAEAIETGSGSVPNGDRPA